LAFQLLSRWERRVFCSKHEEFALRQVEGRLIWRADGILVHKRLQLLALQARVDLRSAMRRTIRGLYKTAIRSRVSATCQRVCVDATLGPWAQRMCWLVLTVVRGRVARRGPLAAPRAEEDASALGVKSWRSALHRLAASPGGAESGEMRLETSGRGDAIVGAGGSLDAATAAVVATGAASCMAKAADF
jgi:hypothetical protein